MDRQVVSIKFSASAARKARRAKPKAQNLGQKDSHLLLVSTNERKSAGSVRRENPPFVEQSNGRRGIELVP